MKKIRQSLILALLPLAAACSSLSAPSTGPLSTDPDKLARQVIDALGGESAIEKTRFLSWKSGPRGYVWDRKEGRCRVESREGTDLIVVLLRTRTREGMFFRNGREVPAAEAAPAIARTADRFANDSFWLMNITAIMDRGAHRAYAGEREIAGKNCPALQVNFDGRPDVYWFYIDPETHLPFAWLAQTAASAGQSGAGAIYLYAKVQKTGALTLPVEYDQLGGTGKVVIGDLQALGSVNDAIFALP